MLGLSSIFLFNFFLHVFCNSTKTSANSSDTISHATLYNTTQRPSVEYKIYKAPPLQLSPVRMEDLQNSPFSCLPCLWSRIEDLQKLTHFGLFRIFLLFEQPLPLWQLSYSTSVFMIICLGFEWQHENVRESKYKKWFHKKIVFVNICLRFSKCN